MIVENAGFGAEAAAPIARRVLDYLLLGQYPSEEDIEAVRQGKGGPPIGVPRKVGEVSMPHGQDAFGGDVPLPTSASASAAASSSPASAP